MGLQGVTGVSRGYMGIQGVRVGCNRLQGL